MLCQYKVKTSIPVSFFETFSSIFITKEWSWFQEWHENQETFSFNTMFNENSNKKPSKTNKRKKTQVH